MRKSNQTALRAIIAVAAVGACMLPGLALAATANSGVTQLDENVDRIMTLITSKWIFLAAAVGLVGGLLSFMNGGEWGQLMNTLLRFGLVVGILSGIAGIIGLFAGNGAVLLLG